MKIPKMVLILGIFLLVPISAQEDEISCTGCHMDLDEPYNLPVELFDEDVHFLAGLNCTACHGGDPEAWDMDEAKSEEFDFIGLPEGKDIVTVCTKCHSNPEYMRSFNPNLPTDQEAKYWTSGHGISLAEGNLEAATCVSCHAVHGIKKSNDPGSTIYHANVDETCGSCHNDESMMAKFGLPHQTVAQYRSSVHGVALLEQGDLAAPTCNNCHGNHGAAPPAVGSIQEVCGTCHVQNQTLFSETKMHQAFVKTNIHGCAACHTSHDIRKSSIDMIGTHDSGVCKTCHVPGDTGMTEGQNIRRTLENLDQELEAAVQQVEVGEQKGLEVEELILDLQNAHSTLIHSSTIVHTFNSEQVEEAAEPGFVVAHAVMLNIEEMLADFRWRRIGLGIATMIISFLALVLYLYIRSIEGR